MTYAISCAGCGQRFVFRSMERIGQRVRRHQCQAAVAGEKKR